MPEDARKAEVQTLARKLKDARTGSLNGLLSAEEMHLAVVALNHFDEISEWEYAMQTTVKGKVAKVSLWGTKERAQERLNYQGTGRTAEEDPIFGPWSAKIIKRRKAGPVLDA